MTTPHFTGWKKSTRSGSAGDNCVEVAVAANGAVGVRDSKNPEKALLAFTAEAWLSFATDIKSGRLDAH